MKGNDFGKAIGIDRPANVRDKIKKWQLELDADAGAESAVGSASENDSKAAPSLKLPSTPKARPVEDKPSPKPAAATTPIPKIVEAVLPERPKSAKQPPVHNKIDDEVHVATAPKKRVISDSHWRNKSPQKDANKKTSPKPLPTAWVRPRPAARKADNPETKVSTPPAQPKTPVIFATKRPETRTRSQRQRRPSRPASSGNGEPPTSSGSGSGKGTKSAGEGPTAPSSADSKGEKTELVRVRRRRAQTSPRGSLSAEDVTSVRPRSMRKSEASLSGDPANLITVEYEPSLAESRVRDEIRERRRKSRRKVQSDVSQDTLPKEFASTARRKTHRRSYQEGDEDAIRLPDAAAEPTPATPPQVFGNRLEAWLSTTPDPFIDADSRRRRKSKDSTAASELTPKRDKSDVSASTDVKSASVEETPERSSESRRRRKRSSTIKAETLGACDTSSPATPTDVTDSRSISQDQDSELTPTLTLKRRGARRKSMHSPSKDRVMSLPARDAPNMEQEAASSAPSSVDPQAMDLDKLSLKPPFESPTMRRLFPSTGKRLSTIVSVETFATKMQQAAPSEVSVSRSVELVDEQSRVTDDVPASDVGTQLETSTIVSRKSTKRSRLASHADLISVLSMPKAGTKSIVSARSIRTNRSRLATASIGDIMGELASDEIKYMRELRTLVDGVIPVLLSCVLSKSDSAVAAGLFSRSSGTDPSAVTKPIIDMGVSLERLKTLHKRVPKEDSDALLSWAQSAKRVYSDYIAAWRLGFQDVVISLAPADDDPFTPAKIVDGPDDGAPWDEGLPRNAEGYVVNSDGERVDVAYMLKRPLVRLKYLAKTLKVGSPRRWLPEIQTFGYGLTFIY
jgi:hypothetical protein